MLDELISLELKIPFGFTNTMAKFLLEDTTKLTKDIVTYIQDECYGFYTPENLRKYNLIKFLQPYKELFGENEEGWMLGSEWTVPNGNDAKKDGIRLVKEIEPKVVKPTEPIIKEQLPLPKPTIVPNIQMIAFDFRI